ncbi:MAG: hypothetical protein QXG10_04130 [Candidatus Hadarchaeales archaeon]
MRAAVKVLAISAVAALVFTGVYLSLKVTFELAGLDFVADGDCFIRVSYHTNRPAVARLLSYDNRVLEEVELPSGSDHAEIKITENRSNPKEPVFLIIEQGGRVIWTGGFSMPVVQLKLIGIVEWGWDPDAGLSTIKCLAVQISNGGGLPAHVYRISGLLDGRLVGGTSTEWEPAGEGIVDRWIMPGAEDNLTVEWSGPSLSPGYHGFKLVAEDIDGEEVAGMVFPAFVNVPSEYIHGGRMVDEWSGEVGAPAGWYRSENWRLR